MSRLLLPGLLVVFQLLAHSSSTTAQVVINEYSASNLNQFVDDHSDYEDWIELYNNDPSPFPIGGYHLSDDSLQPTKYTIPAGAIIPGNGFLRVFCSGRNLTNGSYYHTNFRLTQTKNNKEDIVFTDPSGVILDGLRLDVTQLGHSRGRKPDGATDWYVFTNPTPLASNNAASAYLRYAEKPDFSRFPGFYTTPDSITIVTPEPNSVIRYTTNGNLPTASSTVYTGPIPFNATMVLKALVISGDPAILPSLIEFSTFFMNVSHTFPVISVSGSQLTSLANGNGSLEPKGSFEYFDLSGARAAKTYGEFNRHGQDSWVHSQRSLDFISRDEMGYNHSIEQRLFQYSLRRNFQRVILRAAGDDNFPADYNPDNAGSAHVRDAYVHMLAKKGGMDLDVRNAEKVIVYLNGQYWGVYDIRENPDEHDYTEFYYGQDKYHIQYILTWGATWAEYGGQQALDDWADLYSYIMTHDMSDPVHYDSVMAQLDGKSLVDYVLTNAISVCSDWLNYNTGWWRGLDTSGTHRKWGYILWDNDATFGHYINYTGIPDITAYAAPCDPESLNGPSDPEGHIQVLNRLRNNPVFEQFYIARMTDLWNTVFSCGNMISQLDSITMILTPEMPAHCNRWSGDIADWQTNIAALRSYILTRCNNMAGGIRDCYSLNGPYIITLDADPVGAGSVRLNSLVHTDLPWSGQYFGGMENILEASAISPYQFVNWTSPAQVFAPNDSAVLTSVNFTSSDSIVAHFSFATNAFELKGESLTGSVYPIPAHDRAILEFRLPQSGPVRVSIFNSQGALVASPGDAQQLAAGFHSVQLDLANASLANGLYFVVLDTPSGTGTYRLPVER